jgi:hypothetical protein
VIPNTHSGGYRPKHVRAPWPGVARRAAAQHILGQQRGLTIVEGCCAPRSLVACRNQNRWAGRPQRHQCATVWIPYEPTLVIFCAKILSDHSRNNGCLLEPLGCGGGSAGICQSRRLRHASLPHSVADDPCKSADGNRRLTLYISRTLSRQLLISLGSRFRSR